MTPSFGVRSPERSHPWRLVSRSHTPLSHPWRFVSRSHAPLRQATRVLTLTRAPIQRPEMHELLCETNGDGVVTLTLNRPEKRNALNTALLDQLAARLDALEADAAVRVV